jgi:hypothetical protein
MDAVAHLRGQLVSRPTVFLAKGSSSPTPIACDAQEHHHGSRDDEEVSATGRSPQWGFDRGPKP